MGILKRAHAAKNARTSTGPAKADRRQTGAVRPLPVGRARLHPAEWSQLPAILVAIVLGALVAGGFILGLSQLLNRKWLWSYPAGQTSAIDVVKVSLSIVAGIGGVAALVIAYRRQRSLERDAAGSRDQIRLLTERFGAAADQLGSDKPAVRLAGVYAMATLADEWSEERQQCVDVLCGYLRLDSESGGTDVEIRRAIIQVMKRRLIEDAVISWGELSFDFTGAILQDADFSHCVFRGENTTFTRTQFVGSVALFAGATFGGSYVSFSRASFSVEKVAFERARFPARRVNCNGVRFTCESVAFSNCEFTGESATFAGARFEASYISAFINVKWSNLATNFERATFVGDRVSFRNSHFDSKSFELEGASFEVARKISFTGCSVGSELFNAKRIKMTGKLLTFDRVVMPKGVMTFAHARLNLDISAHDMLVKNDSLSFEEAKIEGDSISFTNSVFEGVLVDFRQATIRAQVINFSESDFSKTRLAAMGAEFVDKTGTELLDIAFASTKFSQGVGPAALPQVARRVRRRRATRRAKTSPAQ